jgi:hypothetical protein
MMQIDNIFLAAAAHEDVEVGKDAPDGEILSGFGKVLALPGRSEAAVAARLPPVYPG